MRIDTRPRKPNAALSVKSSRASIAYRMSTEEEEEWSDVIVVRSDHQHITVNEGGTIAEEPDADKTTTEESFATSSRNEDGSSDLSDANSSFVDGLVSEDKEEDNAWRKESKIETEEYDSWNALPKQPKSPTPDPSLSFWPDSKADGASEEKGATMEDYEASLAGSDKHEEEVPISRRTRSLANDYSEETGTTTKAKTPAPRRAKTKENAGSQPPPNNGLDPTKADPITIFRPDGAVHKLSLRLTKVADVLDILCRHIRANGQNNDQQLLDDVLATLSSTDAERDALDPVTSNLRSRADNGE